MTDHDSVSIKELPFQIYCEYFAYYRTLNKQAKKRFNYRLRILLAVISLLISLIESSSSLRDSLENYFFEYFNSQTYLHFVSLFLKYNFEFCQFCVI